jgi:hypothetical protein
VEWPKVYPRNIRDSYPWGLFLGAFAHFCVVAAFTAHIAASS